MTNAANADEVAAQRRKSKDREGAEADDLKAVLSTIEGRRFVWALIVSCKIFETPLHSNGGIQSANIGRGDVGRELLARINKVDRTLIPKMMLEMAGEGS